VAEVPGDEEMMRASPNIWEKLVAFSSLAVALTGIGAVFFAYYQIRESREEARVQHLVELVQQFDQPPVADARKALAIQRMDAKQEALKPIDVDDPPEAMYDVLNFFEHVSLLANNGYLDKKMVWNEFGFWMFNVYADSRPQIDDDQKNDPAEFAELTKFMETIRKIEIEEGHGKQDHPSQDDILGFYQAEATGAAMPGGREAAPDTLTVTGSARDLLGPFYGRRNCAYCPGVRRRYIPPRPTSGAVVTGHHGSIKKGRAEDFPRLNAAADRREVYVLYGR
jgi:hypothetical protein